MGANSAQSAFIKSAANLEHLPDGSKAEIAILGRSNAGKSTLINSLLKRDLAFVSKTPGKTQLLNFFEFGKNARIVDFPGYGYAQLKKEDVKSWTVIVEGYLSTRQNLVGALVLVDIKRPLTEDETNLVYYLKSHNVPHLLIATKVDKLSRAEADRQLIKWRQYFQESVVPVSAHSNLGIEDLRKLIIREWIEVWSRSLQ